MFLKDLVGAVPADTPHAKIRREFDYRHFPREIRLETVSMETTDTSQPTRGTTPRGSSSCRRRPPLGSVVFRRGGGAASVTHRPPTAGVNRLKNSCFQIKDKSCLRRDYDKNLMFG